MKSLMIKSFSNNPVPAFRCSKCELGQQLAGELIVTRPSLDYAKIQYFLDTRAPEEGVRIISEAGQIVVQSRHNNLMESLYSYSQNDLGMQNLIDTIEKIDLQA